MKIERVKTIHNIMCTSLLIQIERKRRSEEVERETNKKSHPHFQDNGKSCDRNIKRNERRTSEERMNDNVVHDD